MGCLGSADGLIDGLVCSWETIALPAFPQLRLTVKDCKLHCVYLFVVYFISVSSHLLSSKCKRGFKSKKQHTFPPTHMQNRNGGSQSVWLSALQKTDWRFMYQGRWELMSNTFCLFAFLLKIGQQRRDRGNPTGFRLVRLGSLPTLRLTEEMIYNSQKLVS